MPDYSDKKEIVCIGIPCYDSTGYQVLEDYMRFAFHLGRRNQEYDFAIALKPKSEQFRARNAIVAQTLALGCQYLVMLDDDQVMDINRTIGPDSCYDWVAKCIQHLKEDPKKGIVGVLYYQRGAACEPVLMYKNPPGYSFYTHQDITRRLQKVDVVGGGAMVINMKVFDKIDSPWFKPEFGQGTDIQICEKVIDAGWEVWCDTSLELGHLVTDHEIITSKNVHAIRVENSEWMNREDIKKAPILENAKYIVAYEQDVRLYMGKTAGQLEEMREQYVIKQFPTFSKEKVKEYYKNIGPQQIAKNYGFHVIPHVVDQGNLLLSLFNPSIEAHGLDFGCGSAPIGYELMKRGHHVDFYDISPVGPEFAEWRAKKDKISERCYIGLREAYDWMLLLDVIEHIPFTEMEDLMGDLTSRLKPGSSIVTNYWQNTDTANVEHINMQHYEVEQLFDKLNLVMMPIVRGPHVGRNMRWLKAKT